MAVNLLVSLEQAACTALSLYLGNQLTDLRGVYDRWPEPTPSLQNRVVTIQRIGRRQEILYDPVMLGTTIVDATHVQSTWQLKDIEQPVQLDVWCTTDDDRDDVTTQLEEALVQGYGVTLGGFQASTQDPYRHGCLVALAAPWSGNADFLFDEKELMETDDSVQGSEYRATYIGRVTAPWVITTTSASARMARIWLKRHMLDTQALGNAPAPGNYDITEYTDVAGVPKRIHPDTQGP